MEKVKELIENGVDVKSRYFIGGITPLYFARDVEMAKLLIENGADPDAIDNDGNKPCDLVDVLKKELGEFFEK